MAQTHSLDLELSSNQYASAADAAAFDITGAMTLEAWIKLESQPASDTLMAILSKWNASGNQRSFTLSYRDVSGTKNLVFLCTTDGSSSTGISFNITLQTGVWYHIAFSCNANNSPRQASLYVNGRAVVSDDTFTVASGIFSGSAPVLVGCILDGSTVNNPFDGLIKDARIFNDRRTQAEIVADARTQNVSDANLVAEWNFNNSYADSSGGGRDMSGTNSPTFSTDVPWKQASGVSGSTYLETSLVSYWQMEEASGTREDVKGTNDLSSSGSTPSATGKIGDAADIERNSNHLTIADASQSGLDFGGGAISFSAWIKFESTANTKTILAKFSSSGNQQYGWPINGDTTMRFFVSGNGTTLSDSELTVSAFAADTWYHVVVVYDAPNGTVDFYRDGIWLGGFTGYPTGAYTGGSAPFTVGNDGNGTSGFDGLIDELAAYGRALHYGDILDLFNAGSGIPWIGNTEYDQAITATASVSASMLTPKTIVSALTATATASASVATSIGKLLEATATATASVLKGLAMELSATTSITASTLAQRAYLVALTAAVAVSASTQTAIAKVLEATAAISASITKVSMLSQLLEATSTITATIEAGREKVLEATTAITASIQTAIGKTLTAEVSIIAKLLAPFYKTKYPAHGDGDEYEVKYPHDTI